MLSLTLDEIITAWQTAKDKQYHSPEQRTVELTLIQALAEGKPVPAEHLAAAAELPVEAVNEIFESLQKGGADFDALGRLTGLVLALSPTPHVFQLNDIELYAWCALDALFLPGLIGKTAKVTSTCPVTGNAIRLTVRPDGIESAEPEGAVLSIVVPGYSAACGPGQKGGAQGAVCSSMHFFRELEAATTWLVAQPDLAILTLEEAWKLALRVWIEPFKDIDIVPNAAHGR
jgi:alkylmercury lyase